MITSLSDDASLEISQTKFVFSITMLLNLLEFYNVRCSGKKN
jgi:hypothetical protein